MIFRSWLSNRYWPTATYFWSPSVKDPSIPALPLEPSDVTVNVTGVSATGAVGVVTVDADFSCDAAEFDGANDRLTRDDALSGVSDSPDGIISFWFRVNAGDGSNRVLFEPSTAFVQVDLTTANKLLLRTKTPAGTTRFTITSSSAFLAGSGWHHFLATWVNGLAEMFVDDVSEGSAIAPSSNVAWAGQEPWGIAAEPGGSFKAPVCLAEFYVAAGQHVSPLSTTANRRKFITAGGSPVDLGNDGSTPTGAAPTIYLHIDDGEAAANFATNRGTGGNFTVNGALTTCATSPPVSVDATVSATGVAATGAVGTAIVSLQLNVPVTGVAATGAVGAVAVSGTTTVSPTGVAATSAVGTVTASGAAAVSVTGVSATGETGSPTVTGAASVTLTGVEAAGQVGTVEAGTVTLVAVTGVEATGAIGIASVAGDAAVALTGVSAAGEVGTLVVNAGATVSPEGVQAVGTAGDIIIDLALAIAVTGVSAAGEVGNVDILFDTNATVTPTGVEALGEVGTVDATGEIRAPVHVLDFVLTLRGSLDLDFPRTRGINDAV